MVSKFAFSFYLLLLSLLTFFLSKFPGHNGDMPFYIVCAIQLDQGSMNGAVDQAVDYLKQELPADEFIEHSARIKKVTTEYFDFYRVKPLYVLWVLLFHKIGFSYTHSTVYPSLLFFFLTGVTLWRFCGQFMDPVKTFLISLLSVCILPMHVLARLSTPDAMSCFFLLNALLFIYTGRNRMIWFCLLVLAVCARLDNIIGGMILLLALLRWPDANFAGKLRLKEFAFYALILMMVAIMINLIFTDHMLRISDPLAERTTIGYLTDVKWYAVTVSGSFLMALLILFIFTRPGHGFSRKIPVNYMIYVIMAIVFTRFLIYPFYEERFFTPYIIFGMLIIAFQYSDMIFIKKEII
jgi:hypothetical protein